MSAPAWQLLNGLPAWEITEIPRDSHDRGGSDGRDRGLAGAERGTRMQSLAAASRRGSAAAFGWVRAQPGGPVRVVAAGDGLRADEDSAGPVIPLAYPAGARGRVLPPGSGTEAFTALPCWVPVAITPDALLDKSDPPGSVPGQGGPSLEDGLLRAWRGPFGWLALAVPVTRDRRAEMVSGAALAQLDAQRNDSPRAKLAERRARVRHDELRESVSTGLWDVYLLAGGASPRAAVRVAGLLTASLDLRGLPFGLAELEDRAGPLPRLLGARPQTRTADPGPFARDVLAMHGGPDRPAPPPPPGPPPPRPQSFAGQQSYGGQPSVSGQSFSGERGARDSSARWPDPEPEFPCAASSLLLAALAVPPAREIPGIRLALQPDFDVTPETGTGGDGSGIGLGVVLDGTREPAGSLAVAPDSLNRHVFVCGATGSGKSQTVRHLLESATAAGIPWLVIEPAKAEYRLMAARLPGTEVITMRPGDLEAVPAGINPLEPAAGPDGTRFPLQAHADLVRALFLAAFQADEPFPQVLAAALSRCYEEAGWDLVTGEPAVRGASYPSLGDLQTAALAVVEQIGYSREITDNVRGFVSVRIGSLRGGTTGRFLDGGFPIDYGKLLSTNVVLEIEDCGDDTDKAFLTGAVLIRLTEHLRMRARASRQTAPGLRHLTVIEEAHRLLRQPVPGAGSGAAAHAVEMFAGLLAEIRAYGEGLIIAEQIPSKLIPDAIKNTAVKIVHRLPAKDDRDTVGATMNLTDTQSAFLVTLVPGEAAVFTDGMDHPVLARMPDGTARELSAPAVPVSPARLAGARSPACPADCTMSPCTLGQITAARHATGRDPRITLWAELTVLAHLTGWTTPLPLPGFAAALAAVDERVLGCALAHAADAAAATRAPALTPRIMPGPLAAHAATVMRGILRGEPGCTGDELQWLAPACEWDLTAEVLAGAVRAGQAGRHPFSAEWEQSHGRAIPGEDCAAQLAVVTAWQDQAWGNDQRRALTVYGSDPDAGARGGGTSAIEHAIDERKTAPGWRERAGRAVDTTFTQVSWVMDFLAPLPPEDPAVGGDGGGGSDGGDGGQ
jgi:hypothetical protein